MDYYLMLEGSVYGPYSLPQMKSFQLFADTPIHLSIWPTDKWVYAYDLPELRDCISSLNAAGSSTTNSTSSATNVINIVVQQPPQDNSTPTPAVPETSDFTYSAPEPADKGGFGLWLLGLLFPIIGLILWIALVGSKPKKAKSAIVGAIMGFILNLIVLRVNGYW
ncbi:hypothetical protein J5690_01435 [bacterium]|nr:hypothetical protein [bacterium]